MLVKGTQAWSSSGPVLQSFRFLVMMDESVFLGALVVTSKTPAWGNEICQLPPLQTRTRPQEHGCQLLRV